jgi:hypothetical protein
MSLTHVVGQESTIRVPRLQQMTTKFKAPALSSYNDLPAVNMFFVMAREMLNDQVKEVKL